MRFLVCPIAGVALYGGSIASLEYGIPEAPSFHHEYNSMACTIEVVDNIHGAIDHIHQYGRFKLTYGHLQFHLCLLRSPSLARKNGENQLY